jgi:hypothetical protein
MIVWTNYRASSDYYFYTANSITFPRDTHQGANFILQSQKQHGTYASPEIKQRMAT